MTGKFALKSFDGFMEMVFPLYGVRFISITDDFDSDKLHGDTGGINVAFKYLVSEFYSRNLSIRLPEGHKWLHGAE